MRSAWGRVSLVQYGGICLRAGCNCTDMSLYIGQLTLDERTAEPHTLV